MIQNLVFQIPSYWNPMRVNNDLIAINRIDMVNIYDIYEQWVCRKISLQPVQ